MRAPTEHPCTNFADNRKLQAAQDQAISLQSISAARIRVSLFAIALFVYLADRLSKLWVLRNLGDFDQIVMIPGFFHIVHVRNSGAAFGMLAEAAPWIRATFLIGMSSLAVLALVYFVWKAAGSGGYGGLPLRLGLALILGGAAGNIHDRFLYGNVVDFLDFFIGSWHWYTFNIADSAISVGTGLLLIDLWRNPGEKKGG